MVNAHVDRDTSLLRRTPIVRAATGVLLGCRDESLLHHLILGNLTIVHAIVELLGDCQNCCGHDFLDHAANSQNRLGSLLRFRALAVLGMVLEAHSLKTKPSRLLCPSNS